MLNVTSLPVYAGDKRILPGVSFELVSGELTALLGVNGIGKTLLMKIICGLLPAKGGSVTANGASINRDGRVIAYLPQNIESGVELSVMDYVLIGRAPYIGLLSSPNASDRDIASNCMERVGVLHLKERSVAVLSGGEMRRVAIAKLLAQTGEILLLDEPCAYLDALNAQRILELLRRLVTEDKKAALMTLHDPAAAFNFADKVLCMDESGIFAALSPTADSIDTINSCLNRIYSPDFRLIKYEGRFLPLWR